MGIKAFRGVKEKDFTFSDKENCFIGSNGVGKTTCLDAITLLLTGETFVYDKDMAKNRDFNNQRDINEIYILVETDDETINEEGNFVKVIQKLSAKLYEQYKGKKGEKTDEYIKFAVDWYINDEKLTKEKYFERLNNIFNINYNNNIKEFNLNRFLVDYNYSNTCNYQALKKFIESILNITPDNEILKQEQFRMCAYDLVQNNYDIKATNSLYNTKIKALQDKINNINAIIDDINNNNYEILTNEEIELLNKEKESIINSKKPTKEEENKLIELENIRNNNELSINEYNENKKIEFQKNNSKINQEKIDSLVELGKINNDINNINSEGKEIKRLIERLSNENENFNKNIERLNKELNIVSKEECKEIKCPNCNTILNQNEINEWETKKITKTNNIEFSIKEFNNKINQNNELIKQYQNNFNELNNRYKNLNISKGKLELSIEKMVVPVFVPTVNQELVNNYEYSKKEYEDYKTYLSNKEKYTDEEINRINEIDIELKNNIINAKMKENNNEKLELKQSELEKLLDEKCKLELKQIALVDFKEYKTQLIKENTSKVFGDIEWVLQEESKANSNSKQDKCYATLNGVSMDGVNTASKLVLGTKIIECVKKKLGVKGLPLIFDIVDNIGEKALREVESISNNQIFCTMASFNDNVELSLTKEIK